MISKGLYKFAESEEAATSEKSVDSVLETIRRFQSPPVFKAVKNTNETGARYSRLIDRYDDSFGDPMRKQMMPLFDTPNRSQGEDSLPSSLVHHDCALATHMEGIVKEAASKIFSLNLRNFIGEESKLVNWTRGKPGTPLTTKCSMHPSFHFCTLLYCLVQGVRVLSGFRGGL